jgi:signal transduction histidine kinase
MRDMARWIRRSRAVAPLGAGNGQAPGGTLREVAPHRRPLHEAGWVEKLISADHRKDEFPAMLAHELRDPLGVIRNAAALLQREQRLTPAGRRAQVLIERQVRRMARLVDDLLDTSRIRNGQLQLQRERIDLRTVVRKTVEMLAAEISERRQRLTVSLPQSPVWLQADPWRLEQVFVNLLADSSRYTEAAGELAVFMHVRNDQVVVRFRDSGIGIAPSALPQVFDLFMQADAAAPCSRAGLGVGLALARSLVELHGGRVAAASAGLGLGSEFTVRLPLEAGSRGRAAGAAGAPPDPAP